VERFTLPINRLKRGARVFPVVLAETLPPNDRLLEARNGAVHCIAGMPPTLRKVYLLLRIGLPDASLSRAEAA